MEIGAGEGAIGETQAEKKTMILTLVDLPGEIFLGTDDTGKEGKQIPILSSTKRKSAVTQMRSGYVLHHNRLIVHFYL